MKAMVYTEYGPPEVFQLKEVEKPTPKDNEVLVKVHAASLNAADFEYLRGVFIVRLLGFLKPKYKILGSDIAGRVEAVGRNVKQFQPGDEIWGDLSAYGFGTFAEYVCVPENALRLKPASMTFEEAAAVPTAAVVALQNLRGKRPIQPGQKVLINGAGGNKQQASTSSDLSFFDLPYEALRWVFDLNLLGTLVPSQVFGKSMVEQDGGSVLNISSMNAFRPLTRTPAYAAAKAGVSNFTQWLAVHMAQEYGRPEVKLGLDCRLLCR